MIVSESAIAAALAAGEVARGSTSPNPPVGAAIMLDDGSVVATGGTQPPGGAHAEVMALRAAGDLARGATAVVTLEPCNHTGRTGPCSHALLEAGIHRVVYLQPDPTPIAAGGAEFLRSHGVEAYCLHRRVEALHPWLTAQRLHRPHITVKVAQSLDGFSAAVDKSSKWITSPVARHDVHVDRSKRDAIIVGTSTALADNPSLTARKPDGSLYPHQPRRVVIGTRDVCAQATHLSELGFKQFASIELALSTLWDEGCRDVLVEGGATLIGSFFERGLVDAIRAYVAPIMLGDGRSVVHGAHVDTLARAWQFERTGITELGPDVLMVFQRKEV